MKKSYLIALFGASAFWFALALTDSILRDAKSYTDLGAVGKVSIILFCFSFGSIVFMSLVLPVVLYVTNKIKSLWS